MFGGKKVVPKTTGTSALLKKGDEGKREKKKGKKWSKLE